MSILSDNTPKEIIDSFGGCYSFLSNFWECPLTVIGIPYRNSEAAYQAGKTLDIEVRKTFSKLTGAEAKKRGKTVELRPNWDTVTKIEVMELCLRAKFCDPGARRLLVATGEAQLIEGNHWNDTFWGVCRGVGENYLGKLLMEIRSEFIRYNL